MTTTLHATAAAYAEAFETERDREYPSVNAIEARFGYQVAREQLEAAARILACPLKPNGPNWQHGRVLYALTRSYLATHDEPVTLLDIGTAKGFSALCLQWALRDSARFGAVVSLDVLDPDGTPRRNSVLELEGPKRLAEFLADWPEASAITFLKATGVEWLERHPARVNVAFVDGKHTGAVVWKEGRLLADRQRPGDVVMFDDVQIDGVAMAVDQLRSHYTIETVTLSEKRRYALGVRRG